MTASPRRLATGLALALALLATPLGEPARAESLTQAADAMMDRFEAKLPPDARAMMIRPYSPSSARFTEKRNGTLWHLDWGQRISGRVLGDGYMAVLKVGWIVDRFPTPDAARAACRTTLARWGAPTETATIPARIARYDCVEALSNRRIETEKLAVGIRPFAWNTRAFAFVRGAVLVIVVEEAISDDVGRAPAPDFLPTPPVDEIADRLDRLEGTPTAKAEAKPETVTKKPPAEPKPGDTLTPAQRRFIDRLLATPEGRALLATLMATGFAGFGVFFAMGRAGVSRQDVLADLRALLRGRLPPDPHAAWKAKWTALGWRMVLRDGVAAFVPAPGARDEAGRVYDPTSGTFRDPAAPPIPEGDGDVDPATGRVWSDWSGWLDRGAWEAERRQRAEFAATAERARATPSAWDAETARLAGAITAEKASLAADESARAAKVAAWSERLERAYAADGRDPAAIRAAAGAGALGELEALMRGELERSIAAGAAEAGAQARWATAMDAGYWASRAVLAGAKSGMMVAGGPVGLGATVLGSGLISGSEAAAEAAFGAVPGGRKAVAAAFGGGFLSGAKDATVGRITAAPGVGAGTKILLPAAADAGESWLRTGDVRTALGTGALSAAGGVIGSGLSDAAPSLSRDGAELLLGGALGAGQRVMTGGSAGEGFVDGFVGAASGRVGARLADAGVPLSAGEVALDADSARRRAEAKALVADLRDAFADGSPEAKRQAMLDVLSDREAKLLMKGDAVTPELRARWAEAVETGRTAPLFEKTAERLAGATTTAADGTPIARFVVEDAAGTRAVGPQDFALGTGATGRTPGQDLDVAQAPKVIDRATGREMAFGDFEKALHGAARDLGFDPKAQEIVAIDPRGGAEAFALRPGETPKDFMGRAIDFGTEEGRSVSEVLTHKLAEAKLLHGEGAGGVSEQARAAAKDWDRLIEPMMKTQTQARIPAGLDRIEGATGKSALDILREVGSGEMPAGTGNARFRALTGLSIEEGCTRIASVPEALGKGRDLGFAGEGLRIAVPGERVYAPGTSSSAILADALREAMREDAADR